MTSKNNSILEKILLTYAPIAGTIFMVYSYLPQIWLTYSTQNVQGQSLQFWVVLTLGLLSMVGQQIGMIKYRNAKSYTGLTFQIINTLLAIVMMVGVIIFR